SQMLAVWPRRQLPAGTATVPVPVRSARLPATTGRSRTRAMSGPSTYWPVQSSGSPEERTYTAVSVTGTAAATPGTARIAATVGSASPVPPPPGVMTAGAVIRPAAAPGAVPANVASPASIDPAKPTVSRIGAAVAAVRRTAVTALRRASRPVAPGVAASGTVSSHTSGGISTGASIAQPRTRSIATGRSSAPASAGRAGGETPGRAPDPPPAAPPPAPP